MVAGAGGRSSPIAPRSSWRRCDYDGSRDGDAMGGSGCLSSVFILLVVVRSRRSP